MANEDQVAIVVDSAASLPAKVGEHDAVYVVPMQLNIGGRTYLDGRDLAPSEFYRLLRARAGAPTTSAPSPAQFLDAFERAARDHPNIACLTVSRSFSSSFDSARAAAQDAGVSLPHAKVAGLDTQTAAGGEGLVATEAWRVASRDAGLDEVMSAARAVVAKVSLLAFLDTLYYVWKSGRVPAVAHAATSLLQIKPVLEMARGEIHNVARPRTAARAEERMLEQMRRRIGSGPVHATVMHGDAEEQAEALRQRVESEFPCQELYVSEFSPVMGAHTGPGLLGIAFWSRDKGADA